MSHLQKSNHRENSENYPTLKAIKLPLILGLAPFAVLSLFVLVLCGVLGWEWMRQSPTHEELYGGAARFLFDLRDNIRASGQIPWWSSNFLLGHSMAGVSIFSVPIAAGIACVEIFGDPAGSKIAALAVIPLSAFAMFVFMRRLSGSPWTAVAAAMLYTVGAEMLSRLADFQHTASIYSYIFPPLIFWAFLKVAEEHSWRAAAWLAVAWSGMALSYTKLTLLFTPLALTFVVWLWVVRPAARPALLRGTAVALGKLGVSVHFLSFFRKFFLQRRSGPAVRSPETAHSRLKLGTPAARRPYHWVFDGRCRTD